MLLHAAELQLQAAEQSEVGRFNHCLGSMTMTALAVEALLNAVGSRVLAEWQPFERMRPLEKFKVLQAQLGFEYNARKNPWATLHFLAGFRNDIAHVKPQMVTETRRFTEAEANRFLSRMPLSKLEREITIGNARRVLGAVTLVKGILTDALPDNLRFGVYVDAWSGSTTVAEGE